MMRAATFGLSLVLVTSTCLVGGCHSTPRDTAPSPGMADFYPAPLNDPQISILSPELRPWLGFQPAIITKDGEHAMRVEVPVRNLTYEAYNLEYRMMFYDKHGRELNPVMSWEFVRLEPKQIVRLKRNAMSTEAESYRLEVKWSR